MLLKKPKKLELGDKVAIVSLSSGILGESYARHQKNLGEKRLKELGLTAVFMPNALKGVQYLLKNPKARADDLKAAFSNPDIKGIFCSIGGNDTYRLLPYLLDDQSFVDSVHSHPKIFSGFSDTTVNHLMFYQLGMESFYGPNFLNDLAELSNDMLPYTKHTLMSYFENNSTTSIVSSPVWYEERTVFSDISVGTERVQHKEKHGYEVLRGKGTIQGILLGGCLDSFYAILTTTRFPDEKEIITHYHLFPGEEEWKNKILFIETSEEKPYYNLYYEMLKTLEREGVFSSIKAIIVGKPQDEVFYQGYKKALLKVTEPYKTPILYNVNFGHAYPHTVIPYGCNAQINFDKKSLTILEPFFSD